jgi:TDG/mug DNA glycosylase family protein
MNRHQPDQKQETKRIYSFPPVIGDDPRVLILGSMPGPVSLQKGEYYGHPRNHFWNIIYGIFDREPHDKYERRLEFLSSHGIALWDSLASCLRNGSSDQEIREESYNDIVGLVSEHPGIRLIVCNGSKSERSFWRGVDTRGRREELRTMRVECRRLPSTSPIPTKRHKNWRDKLTDWSIIAEYSK